jgi:hypothetical protein
MLFRHTCVLNVYLPAQNGMRHGKGVIKYPDGAMYDGEWKDDLRDG